MKLLKTSLAVLLLTISAASFATTNDGGKKKKHKCNTECTTAKHNYVCGEKKHKCTTACHKDMKAKM